MVDSDFIPPLTNLGDQGDLRAALIRRVPYTFTATDNPEDFTAVDAGTGSIPWALVWAGTLFYFDPNDLTSAHDGITTLVTLDGYRYKTDDVGGERRSVKSRTITAPPTGPALGDSYLVPVGASGAWAAHPNNIAVWTARGWAYIPPEVGQLVFVEDEGGFYHYGTGGAWIAGIGGSALGAGTVKASSLIGGRTHWVVVNQTTDAPPPSPANGVAYIVGPAPTGAWAGQSGRIAVWEINAWAFYVPLEGWTAYDQALNSNLIYNSGWNQQTSGYRDVRIVSDLSQQTGLTGSAGNGVGSGSAPVRTAPRLDEPIGPISVQADYPGQVFEVQYITQRFNAAFTTPGISSPSFRVWLAIFIDSETAARDYVDASLSTGSSAFGAAVLYGGQTFIFSLADISPHQLHISLVAGRQSGSGVVNSVSSGWVERRRVIIRKLA